MSKLQQKVSGVVNNFAVHWKTPPLGKYVPFKEVFAYGLGGMGVQFVMEFANKIALSATSFLVGNTIGIKPMHLQLMAIISTFISFGITMMRSYLIDGVKLKMGKYRPWILAMGIPTIIVSIIFVWLPYETMSYVQKSVSVFVCFNVLQFFFPFYRSAYTDLANVISPNSHERTDVVSVSSIIYSAAPTLIGLFVPMLSTFTGGLNNIHTYRIIYPVLAIAGILLSAFSVFGTKERIIQAKSHVISFKFSDAIRSVAKNKYFWITSLAGWLGFLETAVSVILGWTFIYGYPDKMAFYGIATTLIGNASLWSMLLCPFAVRTIGKRNLLIWSNLINVVIILLLYPFFDNVYMLIALTYINGFVTNFSIVYNPGINADIRDYQQWYTGERIDGMFGTVGMIGGFIGMFTGMVVPAIYQKLGLHDNYDVLEVASVREDLFKILIIAAAVGALLNVIPYFFYDLTECKQKGIVKVLKIRALFEDYGNGVLKDEPLVEAINIIDDAGKLYEKRLGMTTKDDIKKVKQLPAVTAEQKEIRKNEIKKAKQNYRKTVLAMKSDCRERISSAKAMPEAERKAAIKKAKLENKKNKALRDDISVCDFVVDEINKYSTLRYIRKVERAEKILENGESGIRAAEKSVLREARNMPKATYEEKVLRGDAITEARLILSCKKNMLKYYPDGVKKPEEADFEKAENLPEDTFGEKLAKKKAIKALVNEKSAYHKSVKIILDSERLIKEKNSFMHLEEIRAEYDAALIRVNEKNQQKKAELAKIEAERKAEIERRKNERRARRSKGGK